MGKVYAVKKGTRTGLFHTWDECKEATKGYSGAEYKGFPDERSALLWLMGETPKKVKATSEIKALKSKDECNVFVSGIYEATNKLCGLAVIVEDITHKETYLTSVVDSYCEKSKNIAANVLSAYVGLQIAIELGYKNVNLYSSYDGIGHWANKDWAVNSNPVVSHCVRYIDELNKDHRIVIYMLHDVDKAIKKELKFHTGYAISSHSRLSLSQIIDNKVIITNMEESDEA